MLELHDPLCNRLRTMFGNERVPAVDPARSFALSASMRRSFAVLG